MDLPIFQNEIARIAAAVQPARRTPMHHEMWLQACAETINPDDKFEMVVAGDRNNPSAAAPFRLQKSLLIPRLFLLGAEDVWLHSDVLYEDNDAALNLARAVVERGLPARFGHFPALSHFADALKTAAVGKGFVVADVIEGSPYIQIDETWREPEAKLRSKRRSDLRRRRKKAEKAFGAVTTKMLTPSPDEIDALYKVAVGIESRGWKGREQTSLANDQRQNAFFRRYLQLASEAGMVRIFFLHIGEEVAAFQIGVVSDNAFWGFRTSYDESYRDYAPGILLFLEVVRYVANAGLSTHEFLGRPEPWTKEWTSDLRPKLRLRFYPYNIVGAGAFIEDGLHFTAKRSKSWAKSRATKLLPATATLRAAQ